MVDDLRTFDWYRNIKYPELVYQQSNEYMQDFCTAMAVTKLQYQIPSY